MPYPVEDTPVLLLVTLAERHLAEALQAHLVAAGFEDHRVVHHNVMAHVTYEGIRLTELAEKAGITKQAMSELVVDLEQLGYLTRTADPHDRRAKLIGFTDKGRAAVREAMRAFAEIESALGERSLRSLRRGLLTILATPSPARGADRWSRRRIVLPERRQTRHRTSAQEGSPGATCAGHCEAPCGSRANSRLPARTRRRPRRVLTAPSKKACSSASASSTSSASPQRSSDSLAPSKQPSSPRPDVLVFLNSTKHLRVRIDTGLAPEGTPMAKAT